MLFLLKLCITLAGCLWQGDDVPRPIPEDASGGAAIHHAAQAGDVSGIARELAAGVDINLPILHERPRKNGLTPLHLATAHADAATVRFLLDNGANVNAGNELGSVPVIQAAVYGDAGRLRLILDAGADVNHVNQLESTALMCAVAWGDTERVRLLIEAGATVDYQDPTGNTALLYAARFAESGAVGLLLEAGADTTLVDKAGLTALSTAARYGRADNCRVLLPHMDVNHRTKLGGTPLLAAARGGHTNVAKLLLDSGADVNLGSASRSTTPLMVACTYGGSELVSLLIDAGAYLWQGDSWGATPALIAANSEVEPLPKLKLLMNAGADIEAADATGKAALHMAAAAGNVEVVEFLMAEGLDPTLTDRVGNTMLMWAVRSDDAEFIAWLVNEHGHPVDATNHVGWTALTIAARLGTVSAMRALIDVGAVVDHQTEIGETPLMLAAGFADEAGVRLLLEAGADRTLTSRKGWVALDYAAARDEGDSDAQPIIDLLSRDQ